MDSPKSELKNLSEAIRDALDAGANPAEQIRTARAALLERVAARNAAGARPGWLRRSGRIYLDLPAQQPGPITTSWITQGRFLPGQVHSGNRVLIYAGPIATPFLEDVMKFQFSVDGTLLPRPTPVTFHFEMDED